MTGLKLPFWGLSFVEFWCWGLIFGGQGGLGPWGPPGSTPADADDSLTVCCLFCEEGFKIEELCDEHMCADKLQYNKDTENWEKN